MRILLYAQENPDQIYERQLGTEWLRSRRRAAQELAHRLLVQYGPMPGAKVQLTVEHKWLPPTEGTAERVLHYVHIAAANGQRTTEERVLATDLIRNLAQRTVVGMLAAEQVKPSDHVVYFLAGDPAVEGSQFQDTYRLPPALDVSQYPDLIAQIQQALQLQRCPDCRKAACDGRAVAIAEWVRKTMAAWHGEQSSNGTEVGGVLLGYVVVNAPGGLRTLIVDQLPILDAEATVVRWQMSAEHWDVVLRYLAERQAAGDPNLLICGSWHSHDLKAIREATGQPPQADTEKPMALLPSPDDLLLWDMNFGLPYQANAIFDPYSCEVTVYAWRYGQAQPATHLWVPGLPASLGTIGECCDASPVGAER